MQIEDAMKRGSSTSTGCRRETKQQALEKLAAMRNKVGYPDIWRDYSALTVNAGDFFGNVARAARFEWRRQAAKIGKPVDRDEWGMTPPTVNAYYNPQMNDINFPAGVLQPPLLRPEDGRRAELRQHRRHHRPRADARLRRRGPPVRRARATCATGGRRTMRRTSRSARSASATSTRSTSWWTTSRSTAS